VKELLREMVMSATYRQSSQTSAEALSRDPYNRLLSRGARYRLSAEQVRDQALEVAGLLSGKMKGPSVMPPQPPGIWNSPYGKGDKWVESQGEDRYRRGLYTYWKRTSPYPSMETFDRGTGEVTMARRIRTNTPLQALVTLNDPVYIEAARGLAARMEEEGSASIDEKIVSGYRLAMGRSPTDPVASQLRMLYREGVTRFEAEEESARRFTEIGEFEGRGPHMAALTLVANAIMNLDEFLTRN
jgi:hypothetical protein